MNISYEKAAELYLNTIDAVGCQPSQNLSNYNNGRWTLRNANGFLAFVSKNGKVWGLPSGVTA